MAIAVPSVDVSLFLVFSVVQSGAPLDRPKRPENDLGVGVTNDMAGRGVGLCAGLSGKRIVLLDLPANQYIYIYIYQ